MTGPMIPDRTIELYDKVLLNPNNLSAIVALTQTLAESGVRRLADPHSADVASSGGPGSLSTLLCPLHLISFGFDVPKIGVVGRPAGGVDVLGTVPGYRTQLSPAEFEHVLSAAKYAHAIADETWAPADAALFRLRQERGTQAIPALAVASLLAKKLAAGAGLVGLDARVAPHGNFGATVSEASRSAELYCKVAAKLGLTPVVVLTDANTPYQPFIGRGEALTALWQVLCGQVSDSWLATHAAMCAEISSIVANHRTTSPPSDDNHKSGSLAALMETHLNAQGSSWSQLEEQVSFVATHPRTIAFAERSGFVHYNLLQIRESLLRAASAATGQRSTSPAKYSDDAGIRLLCPPWKEIRRGDPVLEFRSVVNSKSPAMQELFSIESTVQGQPNKILEVVSL